MKILVTGGNGYVARNISKKLTNKGYEVLSPSHKELDITNYYQTSQFFDKHQPNGIIHAAAKGIKNSTFSDYTENILMYETLNKIITTNIPVVFYTSGADFDKRYSIENVIENDVVNHWPIDPYGLSKNIIVRRILNKNNYHILRIFAVFNEDELNDRFIKHSVLNIKQNLPIEIYQNKYMDFFYMDDLFTITENLLTTNISQQHLNMSYNKKLTLLDIANIIKKYTEHLNPNIVLYNNLLGNSYTGCSKNLENLKFNLIGLEDGIKKTILKIYDNILYKHC